MNEVSRVVEEERLALMALNEVNGKTMDRVGAVDFLVAMDGLAVFDVVLLPIPPTSRRVGAILIEAPISWCLADLPPFAGLTGGVPTFLQQFRDGIFIRGLGAGPARPP